MTPNRDSRFDINTGVDWRARLFIATDPTQRFSARVDDYVRYRPSYPEDVVDVLRRDCGLSAGSIVADIGSGTGLLAELFLKFGCEVHGVEPNPEMRVAGERMLRSFDRFHSVDARAEDTTLPPASMDFVTAGQAFHWFDPGAARAEFDRILKPQGWVVLVWNERRVSDTPFLRRYEALLQHYATDYARVDHRKIDDSAVQRFFGHDSWRLAIFDNRQYFDLDGVQGRLRSSFYVPLPGTPVHHALIRELAELFQECQQNGTVAFLYETKLYYGNFRLSESPRSPVLTRPGSW